MNEGVKSTPDQEEQMADDKAHDIAQGKDSGTETLVTGDSPADVERQAQDIAEDADERTPTPEDNR